MILVDKEKKEIKIDGNRAQILTELSVLVESLRGDIEDDAIMMAVKLGLCGKDLNKMINIAMETLGKKIKEYENNENTKEIDI